MTFRNYYNRAINENLDDSDERLIGQGKYFKTFEIVDEEGVIKRPIQGGNISETEIKKHQFMKNHENTNVFVKIFKIAPKYIWEEKVDIKQGINICRSFARIYLDISGDGSKFNDSDKRSDFILKALDPLNSIIDWNWWKKIVQDDISNPVFESSKYFLNLRERMSKITSWPVKEFDIHAHNVGVVDRDGSKMLVVIDF